MGFHSESGVGARHPIHNFEYADAAALAAATPVAADIGKVALKQDDDTFWILQDTTPTWAQIDGGGGATAPLTLTDDNATNNGVTNILVLGHNTTGTPAAGLGTGVEFQGESSTTESQLMGVLKYVWRVITHATRTADIVFTTMHEGTEYVRAVLAGTGPNNGATSYDGNTRGENAVDLQSIRWGAATQVASGDLSVIAGGGNNTASAYGATVGGGYGNSASGMYSTIPGGESNLASARDSIAFGTGANSNKAAQLALSSGAPAGAYSAQVSIYHLRRAVTHSSTTWFALQLGPTGAETALTIASNSAWSFDILIVGATSGMGKSFGFHIIGMIENDGGVTTLKGTPTVTTLDNADDVSFSARVTADDTNDALLVEVSDSDAASDLVRWSAMVRTAEVIY